MPSQENEEETIRKLIKNVKQDAETLLKEENLEGS